MNDDSRNKTASNIWAFIGSMRLGIGLLVAASVLSFAALMAGELLPDAFKSLPFLQFLQMSDPFRSWWFRVLLALIGISLLVCILQRGPDLVRQAFLPSFLLSPAQFQDRENLFHYSVERGEAVAEAVLGSLAIKSAIRRLAGGAAYTVSSGGLSRLGPLLVHIGMLLLIIGGITIGVGGRFSRISGAAGDTLRFPEGDFSLYIKDFRIEYYPISLNQWVETPNGRRGQVVKLHSDSARISIPTRNGGAEEIVFALAQLRNDFLVADGHRLTPYQGNIRSYTTDAAALVNGQEVLNRSIEVNRPFRFRGFRIYQSSFEYYQQSMTVDSATLSISQDGRADTTIMTAVSKSDSIALGEGLILTAGRFLPDFRLDETMRAFSVSDELNNPALRLSLIFPDGDMVSQWIFQRATGHATGQLGPLNVRLVDFKGVHTDADQYHTILDVYRSPSAGLIWTGLIAATLGLILGYGLTQRKVWAFVQKRAGGPDEIWITWRSERPSEAFEERMRRILKAMPLEPSGSSKNVR